MKVQIHQCYNHHVKFPLNTLSKLIMKFQGTDYSHYSMSYEHRGQVYFIHSTFPVSRQIPASEFLEIYTLKKTYELTVADGQIHFLFWVSENLGKVYALDQLVGIALRLFKFVKKNPWGAGQAHLICNELVLMFLNKFFDANIEDTDSLDLNETARILDGISHI